MKKTFLITASIVSLVGIVSYFLIGNVENDSKSKNDSQLNESVKKDELFASIPSQKFSIENEEDTIIETEKGLVFYIPKNSFFDKNGKSVKKVDFDVKELSKISEAINEQITNQTTDGKLVKPEKMFSISVKDTQGNELTINEQNPIQVEFPSDNNELHFFQGQKNETEDVLWSSLAQNEKKYLQNIPFDNLDFLPPNFEAYARSKWIFSQESTKKRVDSVYYSLDFLSHVISKNEKVYEVEYQHDSIVVDENDADTSFVEPKKQGDVCKAINPIKIQTIRNQKFGETFIATKEFEERLQIIHKTRDNHILELYVNNLDKNLWEVDEMVVKKLGNSSFAQDFQKFTNQKLTNVKNTPSGKKLAQYYQEQQIRIQKELKKVQENYQKELEKATAKFKQEEAKIQKEIASTKKSYQELLVKRQNYRLKKYNCQIVQNGVYCLGTPLKIFELNVSVVNGNQFDRVHTYIINEEIQSLWAMTSSNKVNFTGGYPEDQFLILQKKQKVLALAIAYKEDSIFCSIQEFSQKNKINIELTLKSISQKDFQELLKTFDDYKQENKLSVDIEFQQKMYQQQKELNKLREKELKRLQSEEVKRQYIQSLIYYLCGETYYVK